MSESGHSESGPAAGAGPPTPTTPRSRLWPALAWLGTVALFLVLVVAVGSWVFQRPIWKGADRPHADGGSIFVHGPQVYTRERLVNDRYQEDSWLNAMLDKSTTEKFGYAVARGTTATDKRTGGVNLSGSAAGGTSTGGAAAPPPGTPAATASGPAGAPAGMAQDSQGLPDISEQPTFKLQATRAYREQIRTLLIENQLDDRHDLHGNTLYRLRFDATILPNEGSRSAAQIEIFIDPPAFQKPTAPAAKTGPAGDPPAAVAGNKEAVPTVASDKVQAGAAGYKEVNEWLANWRDLYERWRANLELRLEDEAVALARSFETGRFGPDDYDVMIRRLRYGVLAIVKDIDEAPRRITRLRDASQQAARRAEEEAAKKKDAAEQTALLDQAKAFQALDKAVTDCVEKSYKAARAKLDKHLSEDPKGFPKDDTADLIETNSGEALKKFREAYLRGVTSSGLAIEQDEAHDIYRNRIRDLLYLRRELTQLTDTTQCASPLSGVTLIEAAVPLQSIVTAASPPAPSPPAPGTVPAAPSPPAAPAAPAMPTGTSTTAAPSPPPPPPPPPGATPPAPAIATAPGATAGSVTLPPAVQPAAPGDPATPSPAPVPTVAAATPQPMQQTAAQLLGSVSGAPPPTSVQLIDAAQLRRRLLDSEFWPRIYKAVTGVDNSMDQGVDRSDARILTPLSLQRFADVAWEPQRARRVFQVREITQTLAVSNDVACLPIATYGPSERFTVAGTPLYVPRLQVGLVKAAAKDMELDWLLDKASSELRDRAREAITLSAQRIAINPCDFRQTRIDVPLGLFNFARRLSQANEIYTYAISPTEPDELIANRIRSDVLREFAVSATVNELAKGNTSLGAGLKQQEDLARFLRMDTTQRSVFGYGERSAKAKIGWRVLPHDPPPTGQPTDHAYLAPRQIPMTALISLPAWWPKVTLTVNRAWIDPQGVTKPIEGPQPNYAIDLPTNFETLDASLFANANSGPVLIDWQIPKLEARPCRPFSVTLIGRRLWRSTVVTLAGERASRVLVMPNMNGIIATFEQAPRPGNLGDKPLGDKPDDKPYLAQLTVWTSQGHVHLPRLIKFEPSDMPPGVDLNCKKIDQAAPSRPQGTTAIVAQPVAPPPVVTPPAAAPATRP